MVWTYTIIFLLAAIPFFEVAMIVPFAIIGGIPAIPVIIIAFLGNLLTIILLIVFIDYVRNWRKKKKRKDKNKRAKKIRSDEHTSELQSRGHLVSRPLL